MKNGNFKDMLEESQTAQAIAEETLKSNKERIAKKRFVIEVPDEYHKAVKMNAALKNISIRAWVSRAIKAQLDNERQYE